MDNEKKFLIGRLIASDGFPVHEGSLKDGFYTIENICEVMRSYNAAITEKYLIIYSEAWEYGAGSKECKFDELEDAVNQLNEKGALIMYIVGISEEFEPPSFGEKFKLPPKK